MLLLNNNFIKMFGPKSLSTYLFYASRILTIVSGICFLSLIYAMTTKNYTSVGNQLRIELPIKGMHLEILNEPNIPIMIISGLLFYSIFFYTFSNVFKTFKARKIFTLRCAKNTC